MEPKPKPVRNPSPTPYRPVPSPSAQLRRQAASPSPRPESGLQPPARATPHQPLPKERDQGTGDSTPTPSLPQPSGGQARPPAKAHWAVEPVPLDRKERDQGTGEPTPTPSLPEPSDAEARPAAKVRWAVEAVPTDRKVSHEPRLQHRIVAIPDCENEMDSVNASLHYAGVLSKKGNLKDKIRGAQIVQTGDLIHKNAPNPAVVPYWEGLRAAAEAAGCSLHLVAGNHELEIWRRLQSGARLGMKRGEQRSVQGLIRTMRIFHAEGSILFIHGYPTVDLLRHVRSYRDETGKPLNDYNGDCFQPALDDPKRVARYAYLRKNACRGCLLHDVPNPASYYRRNGAEVAELLAILGIDLVIHGHRPERSGVQTDYELSQWLPGVRMISHDIQLRLQGLGATVIRHTVDGPRDLEFVNMTRSSRTHRGDVRRLMLTPSHRQGNSSDLQRAAFDGVVASFVRDKDGRAARYSAAARILAP